MDSSMNQVMNLTMNSVCLLFTAMILLYLRVSAERKDKLNTLFSWSCVCNIGMILGDYPYWLCEGLDQPYYPAALSLGMFVQFASGCIAPWVYSLYLHAYLSRRKQMPSWLLWVIHSIFAVSISLLLLNYVNNMYYYLDENNIYRRGAWHWLSQAIPIGMLLFNEGVVFYYRRLMRFRESAAFLSYLAVAIVGIVIQTWLSGISTTYLACSVSIFMIFCCIQSEQEYISEQQKRELDKAHLTVMLSQIQPHFLFNSLQGIKQLCDSEPHMASKALEHFSYYLRGNLDSLTETKLVPFEAEQEHLSNYLYLEKMRFEEKLKIRYEWEVYDFMLPPLTVQPLIENAIKHGINKKKEGGTIILKSERIENNIVITIKDDGVGFDPTKKKEDGRSHIGIENTRNRIHALCGGSLYIESEPGAGTTAMIVLPQLKGKNKIISNQSRRMTK